MATKITQPLSFNAIRDLLRAALKDTVAKLPDQYIYVQDVFPDSVVYELGGKLFQADYSIDKDRKITLGTSVEVAQISSYQPVVMPATFSIEADPVADGSMVVRYGKVGEIGSWPDKGFSLNDAEADEAIAAFTPVENDLDHRETILSGKLGGLVDLEKKGIELFGKVAIPRWLDQLVGKDPLKVSLAWDRVKKRVVGNALTLNPRIEDAQLTAAFNAFSSQISFGAPAPKNTPAPAGTHGGGTMKSLKDRIQAWFSTNRPEDIQEAEINALFVSDEQRQLQERTDGVRQAELRTLDMQAAQFADGLIQDQRILPAEKETVVALFRQAVLDDNGDKALFTSDGNLNAGKRVETLKAAYKARPKHNLTAEQLKAAPEDLAVVFNKTTTTKTETPTIDTAGIYADRSKAMGAK